MTSQELFELIMSALSSLEIDDTERGKRIEIAYLAARVGLGHDGALEGRLNRIREEMSL